LYLFEFDNKDDSPVLKSHIYIEFDGLNFFCSSTTLYVLKRASVWMIETSVEKQIGFGTGSDIVIKITDPVTCAKGRGGARANTPHPSGKKTPLPRREGKWLPHKKNRAAPRAVQFFC